MERIEEGGGDANSSSLRVLTAEPGVQVEVRSGREVVASGPTPCVANGIPSGTYTIVVRDPLYNEGETTLILGAGAMEDVTLVTSRRTTPGPVRAPATLKKRGRKRIAATSVLFVALAASSYAQPWGRTVDASGLQALVDGGRVTDLWVTDGGVEGGVIVAPAVVRGPLPMLAEFTTPFFMSVDEGDIPELVTSMSARGVTVDASWEIRRLRDLAVEAQTRRRYFGVAGGDVQSYALRLTELDPQSDVATALLMKVAERMAWAAEVTIAEGPPERVDELLQQCLDLVPDHPRCVEVSEGR